MMFIRINSSYTTIQPSSTFYDRLYYSNEYLVKHLTLNGSNITSEVKTKYLVSHSRLPTDVEQYFLSRLKTCHGLGDVYYPRSTYYTTLILSYRVLRLQNYGRIMQNETKDFNFRFAFQ